MLDLRAWATARAMPLFLLGVAMLFGVALAWGGTNEASSKALHGAIFLVGPVLVVLDRFRQNAPHLWQHHTETALRVATLAGLYALTPSTVGSMMGNVANFFAIYMGASLGLQNFLVRPSHILRHDNKAHTGFLAVLVLGVVGEIAFKSVQVGVGTTLLALTMVVVLVGWRHALWYNAHRELSPGQHAAVWPAHAARVGGGQPFWKDAKVYLAQYPAMPVLNTLSVPVLLSFFTATSDTGIARNPFSAFEGGDTSPSPLAEDIKTAINAKEPRAVFVWQLYPEKEAAIAIGQIEEFAARAEQESFELPAL